MSVLAQMLSEAVEDAQTSAPRPGYVSDINLASVRLKDALESYQKPSLKVGDFVTPSLTSAYNTPAKGEFAIVAEIITGDEPNPGDVVYRVNDIVILVMVTKSSGTEVVPFSVDSRFFEKVDVEAEVSNVTEMPDALAEADAPTTPYPSDTDEGCGP